MSKSAIEIGKVGRSTFALPADAVSQTFGLIGIRGSGKTHTAVVMVEGILDTRQQVVVLDPLDVWWGLRAGRDGKSAGMSIVVFGGEHGDLPIGEHDGATVADAIVEHGISAIVCVSLMSKGKQRQFVTDFAERLYDRKGIDRFKTPLMLAIDEADAFCPQRVGNQEARMVGAIEDIVRRGRARGLGVTLITQRAAVLNKDVLTQCETLVCLRLIGPQDRAAVQAWVSAHDTAGRGDEFIGSLASLPRGTAWFWSPAWLDVFDRVEVRQRRTFDSSRTPKAGERRREPKRLTRVDVEALRGKLAQTIETAKASDPRELRKRIAELEKQLKSRNGEAIDPRPLIVKAVADRDRHWARTIDALRKTLAGRAKAAIADVFQEKIELADPPAVPAAATKPDHRPAVPPPRVTGARSPSRAGARSVEGLSRKAERVILAALYHHSPCSKRKLAIVSGYSGRGGAFGSALSTLRNVSPEPYATGSDPIEITDAGRTALGDVDPLPTGEELIEHWLKQMSRKAERVILRAIVDAYPNAITKDEIAAATGYEVSGGAFGSALSKLRTLELIDGRNELVASEELFT